MPDQKRILIAGAGVAGPALALILSRCGHACTIVERAPDWRTSGQQTDVSGEGLKVIEILRVKEALWAKRVEDHGLKFVDAGDGVIASFPVSETSGLVKELEILRPDLAGVFFEATRGRVEYLFDEMVEGVEEREGGVEVRFKKSERRGFDLVVAADGLRSRTREVAFPEGNTRIVELGQACGFFAIPWRESDGMWSRWYNATGGRCTCLRPNKQKGTTSALLAQVTPDAAYLAGLPKEEQKKAVAERFGDAGWETQRVLDHLAGPEGENFYLLEAAQAKSTTLINGRAALLGDAGYCPSPLSGQGTTIALIGAYTLGGCIATYPDYREALSEYEKLMKPFVETIQKLPPGVPWIVNPQTSTGISVLNNVLWIVGKAVNSSIASVLGKVTQPASKLLFSEGPKLPDFPVVKAAFESEKSL